MAFIGAKEVEAIRAQASANLVAVCASDNPFRVSEAEAFIYQGFPVSGDHLARYGVKVVVDSWP